MKPRQAAKLISAVFDPVIMVPATAGLLAMTVLNRQAYPPLLWGVLVFTDVILPAFAFLYSRGQRHWRDWDLRRRDDRFPVFVGVGIGHFMGVVVAYLFLLHPLAEYLLAFWLVTLLFTFITMEWKISIHTGAMAVFATLVNLWYGPGNFFWLWGAVAAVGWARVVDKDHTPAQVIAGAALPYLVITAVFSWAGLSG